MQIEDVTRTTSSESKKEKKIKNYSMIYININIYIYIYIYYNNEPISLTPSNATKDQISLYVPWHTAGISSESFRLILQNQKLICVIGTVQSYLRF